MLRVAVTAGADEWVFGFPQAEIIIGAAPDSSLVLAHARVTTRHAKLVVQHTNVYVERLDATAQVRVNETLTTRTIVRDGDVITIGPYTLGVLPLEEPSKTEADFLTALERAPSDDALRAVYGDWLEEAGRHDHATFLRAQIELRGHPAGTPRFHELMLSIERLAPQMSLAWRRAVARPRIEGCPYRFELTCPKTWDELTPTDKPDVRWCKVCEDPVHYAGSIDQARRLAIAGQCVAVDVTVPRYPDDLEPESIRVAGRMAPVR